MSFHIYIYIIYLLSLFSSLFFHISRCIEPVFTCQSAAGLHGHSSSNVEEAVEREGVQWLLAAVDKEKEEKALRSPNTLTFTSFISLI